MPINAQAKSPRPARRGRPHPLHQAVPADLLDDAVEVFGSVAEAEAWFAGPAIGLGQQRPIDLVKTATGRGRVRLLLGQIRYGVYV